MAVIEAVGEAAAATGTYVGKTIVEETTIAAALDLRKTIDTIDLDHVAKTMMGENDLNADAPEARRRR